MANPVLGTDNIAAMIEAQKGFDAMASSVGLVERKYAGLKGAIKGNLFVKSAIQIKNWGKQMIASIDTMSDWRNMSDEEKEARKENMSILQKLLVPMMAYTKLGSGMNKIMGKHNNILTRMATRLLSMFAILGLIIFVFAAVSIAIDGANSPIVELSEGIWGLEKVVGGLVVALSGEDGEGGLVGSLNLVVATAAVFLLVAAVFGTAFASIIAGAIFVVGVFNLVKNATGDTTTAVMAALSAATIAIGAFVWFMGWATMTTMALPLLWVAGIFAIGAAFWAVATGKASDAVAWIAGIGLAILLIVTGMATAVVAIPIALVAVLVVLAIKHRDWLLGGISNLGSTLVSAGGKLLNGALTFAVAIIALPWLIIAGIAKAIASFFSMSKKERKKWFMNMTQSVIKNWRKLKNGVKAAVAWIADTPNRSWAATKRGLAGAALSFIQWYNRNIAGFLSFKVPNWVPRIGGNRVNIPPKVKVPMLAEGGIVTSPTLAMIGEKGPEAVVPLGKGGHGMGQTFNIKIDVSGVTDRSDKKQLAMQISNEIQKEMRRWGRGNTRRAI